MGRRDGKTASGVGWVRHFTKAHETHHTGRGSRFGEAIRIVLFLMMLGDHDFVSVDHTLELFRLVPEGRLACCLAPTTAAL